MVKDVAQGLIYASRSCSTSGQCVYKSEFPLQNWNGKVPWNVIYPLRQCRVGDSAWRVPCPNKPVELIRGWNNGEYQAQSVVPIASTAPGIANSAPSVRP